MEAGAFFSPPSIHLQFLPQVKLAAHILSTTHQIPSLPCISPSLYHALPFPGCFFLNARTNMGVPVHGTCSVKLHNQMRGFQSW